MQPEIKQRIPALMESIEDEVKLQMLIENIEDYMDENKENDLSDSEMEEIDETLAEIKRGDCISRNDLQKEMKQ